MAIVVPKPPEEILPFFTLTNNNFDVVNQFRSPCWAPIGVSTVRAIARARVEKNGEPADWVEGVLKAAHTKDENAASHKNITGIKCPKPIGIVTFEDIISAILQKPNRPHINFFEGVLGTTKTTTLTEKVRGALAGSKDTENSKNGSSTPSAPLDALNAVPLYVRNVGSGSVSKRSTSGQLRKRNVSNKEKGGVRNMDGAGEEGIEMHTITKRSVSSGSCYTRNSQGGFHHDYDIESANVSANCLEVKQKGKGKDLGMGMGMDGAADEQDHDENVYERFGGSTDTEYGKFISRYKKTFKCIDG